ncbi:DUF2490 domain-containing protein [Perlabentimonas gracilis]|uniref:DUF2490 domain-containing protein n=1 Tax=Perlabentimonas gracilis TaxID=2715279 RepID=UPI00140C9225|nr:DUF2490 domain-containing protein [Perlabentimonas gracilis]NHB69096.1 DUF2490 domain-containing protein [Perlabentimonas gracilis]
MRRYSLLLLTVLVFSLNSLAQSSFVLGFLPSINLNKRLPQDWSLNLKTESRQSIAKQEFSYEYLLTDISIAASKKIGINTSIAIGYLARVDENSLKNRSMQQITFIKRYPGFRLAHRLLTDQTFAKDDDAEFRLRYRISSEIPLQGSSLDPKEFFAKLSNEYLNSLQGKSYDMEIRWASFIGYAISPANKIELGFDYRIDSFIEGSSRNRVWLSLNFYTSI